MKKIFVPGATGQIGRNWFQPCASFMATLMLLPPPSTKKDSTNQAESLSNSIYLLKTGTLNPTGQTFFKSLVSTSSATQAQSKEGVIIHVRLLAAITFFFPFSVPELLPSGPKACHHYPLNSHWSICTACHWCVLFLKSPLFL